MGSLELFNVFKSIIENVINKKDITYEDFIFSFYKLTSNEYKENNRLIDSINDKQIILNFKKHKLNVILNKNILDEINIEKYITNEYMKSDIYNILENLLSFTFKNYVILYNKYVLDIDMSDFVDYKLYIDNKKIHPFLRDRKAFINI